MKKKPIVSASDAIIARFKILTRGNEQIRLKLVDVAKQLAKTAKEKEIIRRKLAITAEKLSVKAKELALTIVKREAILDSIGDAVMACDSEGRIILFNRKSVAMTGFSAREVIGKHYKDILKFVREKDDKPSKDFIAEAMKTGYKTTMADNTLLIRKNGTKIAVTDSAEPIRYTHGVLIGCVIVFRDITQEKEIDRAKSEFISVASHQLKTPATIVNLYTEMLLNSPSGVTSPKQKDHINEIRIANQRIIDIINTLLNVSRIEMGIFSVEPEKIDTVLVIKAVIKELQASAQEKSIILEEKHHELKHILQVDKLLLGMVFSNVVSNAIRYSHVSGKVSIESKKAKAGEVVGGVVIAQDSLLVSVKDDGCGIPHAEQSKVFTKFFRADNARAKQTDGTGLGLYIVKSILDHIGGQVWFQSKENQGSIFYFTIPIKRMGKNRGEKLLTI